MRERKVEMRALGAGLVRWAAAAFVAAAAVGAGRADAAVAYVSGFGNTPLANANPNAVTWSSGNVSVTPGAGSNRLLVVVVSATEGSGITSFTASATYNGATATQAVVSSANNTRNQLWIGYFKEAALPAGAANLAVTITSDQSFSGASVFAGTYQGVDQTTPITGSGSATTTGATTLTLASAVASNAGGAYVAAVSHSTGSTLSSITPATFTARVTDDAGPNVGSNVQDKLTGSAASETTASTFGASARQTLAVVSLNPASTVVNVAQAADPANTVSLGQTAAIDAFTLGTNSAASANVNSVTLTLTNPSALSGVFLYSSSACTGGTQFGTTAAPAASVTLGSLTMPATPTTPTTYWVCGTGATVAASTTVTAVVASATTNTAGYTVSASTDTAGSLTVVPPSISIAQVTDPTNSVYGGTAAAIDAFALQTNAGSATVSGVTVTLTNPAGLTGVFLYSAAGCTGGTQYGTTQASAASVSFASTGIPATTTATTFYVCGTAANVSAATAVTAVVASATTSTAGYVVSASTDAAGTLTVNPKLVNVAQATDPTNSATAGGTAAIDAFTLATNTGSATVSGVTVTLTNPSALTGVFLYSAATCTGGTQYGTTQAPSASVAFSGLTVPVTTAPATAYVCGTAGTVASSTAVTAVVASATTSTAGFTVAASTDAAGTLTVTPPPVPGTTTGAIAATVNSCALVTVTASYAGDTNGNNTVTFSRSTDNVTYAALAACTTVGGGTNPRACADSTVAASTSYWYRALFADADGVSGTNPITTAASVNTGACNPSLALANPGGQPAAGTITVGAAAWTRVGIFTLAASSGTVYLGSVAVVNGATGTQATAGDLQLNLTDSTGALVYSTGSWDGTKWVFGTVLDPSSGQPVSVGTAPVTFNVYATANYGAAPAETFAMQLAAANVVGLAPALATTGATFTANTFTTAAPALVNEGSLSSTSAPMVSIVNPDRGKVVSGNVLVQIYVYSANGSAVTALGLTTDGTTPTCAANDATITKTSHTYANAKAAMYSKLVSALAPGTYTLKACATNTGGTIVSPPVTVTWRAAGSGDGNLLVRDNASQLCSDCHDQNKIMTHSSEATASKYGTWSVNCRDCHTPHSTRNLYLIREQVVPPAVNGYQATKNVYLATKVGDSNVSGATSPASSSFANTDGSGVCQACHTRTMNPSRTFTNASYTNASTTVTTSSAVFAATDVNAWILGPDGRSYSISAYVSATQVTLASAYQGATVTGAKLIVGPSRWRAAGNQDAHYTAAAGTAACTGCHSHSKGFAGGESSGGSNCAGCHGAIWTAMTATTNSRHVLGTVVGTNDSFKDDATVNWGTQTSLGAITLAQRSCVNMCHDDHVHDLSPGTTHEQDVYGDARSSTSRAMTRDASGNVTAGTPAKVDFAYNASTQAWGGMCTSCHQTQVDASRPAVVASAFAASAHAGVTTTDGTTTYAWSYTLHDGSAFNRSCTKCHASRAEGTTPTYALAGSNAAAVHATTDPALLSGTRNPAGTASGYVCYNCHGSLASPGAAAQGNRSKKNIQAEIAKTGSTHPVNADAVHNTVTESTNAAFGNTLGVTGRHVNCADCHDPHQAKSGLRTVGGANGSTIGGALAGAWGADLTSNPAFWTAGAAGSFTKATLVTGTPGVGQDNLEATLCFKCHSSFYGTLPTAPSSVGLPSPIAAAGFTETDTALEFNPANAGNWKTAGTANQYDGGETAGSFHPVLADSSSNLGAINLSNLVTTNFAWANSGTTRNRMRCSDCHGSDGVTDPVGPHGSAAKFQLRGPNTTWTQATVGSTAGIFCWNCHSSSYANTRFSAHNTHESSVVVPCMNCHVAIPHGSMRPGLLSPGNGGCGVNGGTSCGPTSMNINVGGPVVACQNGNGAGVNCLATDNPPYNQAGTTQNKLRLAYYPANATTDWGSTTAFCGCGNVIGGQGH